MPKYKKLKVTKICGYHPSSFEYKNGDRSDLYVPIVFSDINNENKKVIINIYGIDSRMWVATDPYKIDISTISSYITKIDKHGTSFDKGKDLWRIHTKYPFEIPIIRNFFENLNFWTGMGDIPYERAFPIHYGMKSRYVGVKNIEKNMNISELVML